MRLLLINSVCGIGSTGKICCQIADEYSAKGYEVKIAYGREPYVPKEYKKYAVQIGNKWDVRWHALYTRLTDKHGLASQKATREFLKWASDFDPDVLWLHNIHGYYINYEMLFEWIKSRPHMEVKWTLHDCWAFTGHCSHFSYVNCNKWKLECKRCIQRNEYPCSFIIDNSENNYWRKKKAFSEIPRLTIISPSKWLKDLISYSFLSSYPVEIAYNRIDTTIFKPTPSDFKERFDLNNKIIVLGVANLWNDRKGLKDFVRLASMLDERFTIVMVGLSKTQIREMPDRILALPRTKSSQDLAKVYTAADVFINLTYEDNYPTVNLEAIACGVPVITYETGGSPETIVGHKGMVVPCGNLEYVAEIIMKNSLSCY